MILSEQYGNILINKLHRNYMTTFRADVSWSSLFAAQENVFMSICDDKDRTKHEGVYKMLKKEKELLDTFTYAVNNGSILVSPFKILLIAGRSY